MGEAIALKKKKQSSLDKGVKNIKNKIKVGSVAVNKDAPAQTKRRKFNYLKGRGTIYISHIPHGFYENEMKKYFEQFGVVTRMRIVRSTKTDSSRGYGFVEFQDKDVAQIVADTMDNYLMFKRRLDVKYLPYSITKNKQIFNNKVKGIQQYQFESSLRLSKYNKHKNPEGELKRADLQKTKLQRKLAKLNAMGIEHSLEPVVSKTLTNPKVLEEKPKKAKLLNRISNKEMIDYIKYINDEKTSEDETVDESELKKPAMKRKMVKQNKSENDDEKVKKTKKTARKVADDDVEEPKSARITRNKAATVTEKEETAKSEKKVRSSPVKLALKKKSASKVAKKVIKKEIPLEAKSKLTEKKIKKRIVVDDKENAEDATHNTPETRSSKKILTDITKILAKTKNDLEKLKASKSTRETRSSTKMDAKDTKKSKTTTIKAKDENTNTEQQQAIKEKKKSLKTIVKKKKKEKTPKNVTLNERKKKAVQSILDSSLVKKTKVSKKK